MARDLSGYQEHLAQLAKLPDSALVNTRLSRDCTYWIAWMMVPKEKSFVSTPDFSSSKGTEEAAIKGCANKIRAAANDGSLDMYWFAYHWLPEWEKRAEQKAPTNVDPTRTVMYDPKVNDTKWGLIREGKCGHIEGSGENIFKDPRWESMLESVYTNADIVINNERRVYDEFHSLRARHKEFTKTFSKFIRPYVERAWEDVHDGEPNAYGKYTGVRTIAAMLAAMWVKQGKLEATLT